MYGHTIPVLKSGGHEWMNLQSIHKILTRLMHHAEQPWTYLSHSTRQSQPPLYDIEPWYDIEPLYDIEQWNKELFLWWNDRRWAGHRENVGYWCRMEQRYNYTEFANLEYNNKTLSAACVYWPQHICHMNTKCIGLSEYNHNKGYSRGELCILKGRDGN